MLKQLSLVLFEPDIPQNTGSLIRLSACLGTHLHIIEPCGFAFDDKRMKRTVMDYYDLAQITRHVSWDKFRVFAKEQQARLILLTTKTSQSYTDFSFKEGDMLLLGRESSGVPDHVREAVDAGVTIPLQSGARSLNVALAAAMVLGEGIRQINVTPHLLRGLVKTREIPQ